MIDSIFEKISSPSNGVNETEANGFLNKNPTDPNYGDLHVYNYYADGWQPSSYPQNARFVSEYGENSNLIYTRLRLGCKCFF